MEQPQTPFAFAPSRKKRSKAAKRYEREQAAKVERARRAAIDPSFAAELEKLELQNVPPLPWKDAPIASWDTASTSTDWDTVSNFSNFTISSTKPALASVKSASAWNKPLAWVESASSPLAKIQLATIPEVWEAQCKDQLAAEQGWPRKSQPEKQITLAPFYENSSSYVSSAPKIVQTSHFFKLMDNDLIRRKIMAIISRSHEAATCFSLTSKRAWRVFAEDIDFWDFTQGAYNNCDWPRDDPTVPEDLQGSVAPVVIVSPFRSTSMLVTKRPRVSFDRVRKSRAEAAQDGLNPASDAGYEPIYPSQLKSLHKMCISMNNFADFFQNLQFHRTPFLTKEVLALIIPSMRNLKHLGIFRCPLIHIGNTLEILEIIKTDRPIEKERQVNLELFPNFHIGPVKSPGNIYFTGEYGATWDNFNGRTDLAIWGLVLRIMRKARDYGIDLFGKGTAFRQWLEMSPCWRVEKTLRIMDKYLSKKCDALEMIAWLDYKLYRGEVFKITGEYRQFETNAEGTIWLTETKHCDDCQRKVLGIFWDHGSWRSSKIFNEPGHCLPCKLDGYLEEEKDHYKKGKKSLIKMWLAESTTDHFSDSFPTEDLNTTNLPRAIQGFRDKKMLVPAWELDDARRKEMFFVTKGKRVDREYGDRQRPWVKKEMNKIGKIMRSPWIDEKDVDLREGEGMWTTVDETRRWAHGHWYN